MLSREDAVHTGGAGCGYTADDGHVTSTHSLYENSYTISGYLPETTWFCTQYSPKAYFQAGNFDFLILPIVHLGAAGYVRLIHTLR